MIFSKRTLLKSGAALRFVLSRQRARRPHIDNQRILLWLISVLRAIPQGARGGCVLRILVRKEHLVENSVFGMLPAQVQARVVVFDQNTGGGSLPRTEPPRNRATTQ